MTAINYSEQVKTWTFDQLYERSDEPPTEDIPPRDDEHTYILQGSGSKVPAAQLDGDQVVVRTVGDLTLHEPIVTGGERLPLDELAKFGEGTNQRDAHRPPWLGIQYQPRIRPRLLNAYAPAGHMRPRISESLGSDWPWTTCGRLFINRTDGVKKAGTGVLVGPRLLLTASHNMPWDNPQASIRFVPAYRNGNDPRFGHAYVDGWRGVVNEFDVTGLDYVICRLNWRIGDRAGWLGSAWRSSESFYYNGSWLSVGYPGSFMNGERPALEVPVPVHDIDNDGDGLEIETHLFAFEGWSGGPMWGWVVDQPRIVGVVSGYETDVFDPTRTVFAGGQHMVNLVNFGWANWG
jgi:hypothetical protein